MRLSTYIRLCVAASLGAGALFTFALTIFLMILSLVD